MLRTAVLGMAVLVCAAVATSALGATKVPNPCTVVPAGTVASTVGLTGVGWAGKVSSRPAQTVTQTICTFTHGDAKVEITLNPHLTGGGFGGPPGMVISKPGGFGATTAVYAYDLNPKFAFASVSFNKGAIDGFVWDNGKVPHGDILALAHKVYAALP